MVVDIVKIVTVFIVVIILVSCTKVQVERKDVLIHYDTQEIVNNVCMSWGLQSGLDGCACFEDDGFDRDNMSPCVLPEGINCVIYMWTRKVEKHEIDHCFVGKFHD